MSGGITCDFLFSYLIYTGFSRLNELVLFLDFKKYLFSSGGNGHIFLFDSWKESQKYLLHSSQVLLPFMTGTFWTHIVRKSAEYQRNIPISLFPSKQSHFRFVYLCLHCPHFPSAAPALSCPSTIFHLHILKFLILLQDSVQMSLPPTCLHF